MKDREEGENEAAVGCNRHVESEGKRQPARRAGPTLALQVWGATAGRAAGAMGFFRPRSRGASE
jgi:hypothetical protein